MPNGTQEQRSRAADPDPGAAQSFAETLRQQTEGYVEKRKADAARLVSDVGDAIRDTGSNFDGLPQLKEFFGQAALGVDELAVPLRGLLLDLPCTRRPLGNAAALRVDVGDDLLLDQRSHPRTPPCRSPGWSGIWCGAALAYTPAYTNFLPSLSSIGNR